MFRKGIVRQAFRRTIQASMTKGEGPPPGFSCPRFLYPRLAGRERIESRFSWSRRRKSSNSNGRGSRLLFASVYDFSSPRLTNRLLTLDSTIGMTFNLKSPRRFCPIYRSDEISRHRERFRRYLAASSLCCQTR